MAAVTVSDDELYAAAVAALLTGTLAVDREGWLVWRGTNVILSDAELALVLQQDWREFLRSRRGAAAVVLRLVVAPEVRQRIARLAGM